MSGVVVSFPGITEHHAARDAQPQKEVVEMLVSALERAKRGEIQALAIAYIEPGEFTNYEWVMPTSARATHMLPAAASDLLYELSAERLRVRRSLHEADDDGPEAA